MCKRLEKLQDDKPGFFRELLREKHQAQVLKNQTLREVKLAHQTGIADPGRLAAKLERRMFFGEHIKIDDGGKKKHIVNQW